MKKSVKKYITIGAIIKPKETEHFYQVTELFERKFKCKIITDNEYCKHWEQEFYYNIEMTIYNAVASNVA